MNRKSPKIIILVFLSIAVLSSGFILYDQYFEISKNLEIFNSAFREINAGYVEPVNPGKFMKQALDAGLNSLDPYTVLYTENELEDYRFLLSGEYGGLGATYAIRDGSVVLTEIFENSQAARLGFTPGDILLSVNGIKLFRKTEEEVSTLLKGQPGSTVQITYVSFTDNNEKNITVQRSEVKPKNIPYFGIISSPEEGVGYIRLLSFTDQCSREVKDAFMDLKNKGMKYLILDLRGNPGGLLHEAVNLVNLFVERGTEVVFTKGRFSLWDKSYVTQNQPIDAQIPLCVLVDENSASASEIVAGAIQDLDRGIVVGRRTFGKGLVQQTKDLVYNTKLKYTVAKYYIPSGRCIQALDYSNRDEEGRVEKIPDSLITAFKTRRGRIVYDGAGIRPDQELNDEFQSGIFKALQDEWVIFDFALEYRRKNNTIPDPQQFRLGDKDWEDFLQFLKKKNFVYKSESFVHLENLTESLKKDGNWEFVDKRIEEVRQQLFKSQKEELNFRKKDILYLLEREIIKQVYKESGVSGFSVHRDPDIIRSRDLIKNTSRYQELLTRIEKPTRPFNPLKKF